MRATANLLTLCVSVGVLLPTPVAIAGPYPLSSAAALAVAAATQSGGQNGAQSADPRRESSRLLRLARQAMQDGDVRLAESYVQRAESLNVEYDSLFARFEDTPAKVRQDLADLQAKGGAALARPQVPGDPFAGRADSGEAEMAAAGRGGAYPAAAVAGDAQAHSDALLIGARKALSQGDAQRAAELATQAKELGVAYPLHADSPEKVQALIRRAHQLSATPPAARDNPTYVRQYGQLLLDQADGLLRYRDLNGARKLALQAQQLPVEYGQFERTPDQVLAQIAAVAAGKNVQPQLPADEPVEEKLTFGGGAPAGDTANDPRKAEALRLVALVRAALDRGDVALAKRLAEEAQELRVPDGAFAADETRPWEVMLEVDQALKRRRSQVVPAIGLAADESADRAEGENRYPVAQGVYNPGMDGTLNLPAQATSPAPASRLPEAPSGNQPNSPSADTASEGERLYEQGLQALQQRDREVALQLFSEAWQHEQQLDPVTRQQLKDKLTLLQTATTPPAGGASQPSALEEVDARQQLLQQKLYREITAEQSAAERMRDENPKGALQRLQALRGRVSQSELDPAARKQLLTVVDRSVKDLEQYIEQNRGDIELNEQNAAIRNDLEVGRQRQLEVQDQVADMVEKFNKLLDEQRYAEAEIVAKQARELDPESPVVQNLVWKSRFVRRIQEQVTLQERKEMGFNDALTSVEESSTPFDDRNPMVFDVKNWKDLTLSRRKMLEQQRNRMSPAEQEIHRSLTKQVEVRFTDRPLAEVMETLGLMAGVNVFLDPQGLAAEGVTTDTPVTLNLAQSISLRSALNLILEPLHLSYVIQNEVLRVTSEQTRASDVYSKVYNVADLVIPIPNFIPSYNIGLPGAIREAHNALGYGMTPSGSGSGPLMLANNEGANSAAANASVLAQMGANGMLRSMGSRPSQPMSFGPGGLGGASAADFDSLIELLTTTIEPDTWDTVGGPGAIKEFDTNLSLVISQTQEVHEKIADLLEQLRRLQDLQVTIEVRFMTISDNFFERIGIDFDFDIDDNVNIPSSDIADLDDRGPSVTIGLEPDGIPTADLDLSFTQDSFGPAVPQFGGFDAATAANFGFAILSDIEVFFLLQAAQGDRRSNVLQAPKVTLFNGQQASVSDTSQRPFVTSVIPVVGDFAAAHQPVIVVLSEGTSLSVQAVVSADRRFVRLTLVPFFSRIGDVQEFTFNGKTTSDTGTNVVDAEGNPQGVNNKVTTTEGTTVQLPTFSFTTVTTTVSVPDGGTVLLGGIKRLSEGRNERGVPMLSKLPWINRLFKNVGIGRETESLMMMVTPRILIQEEEEEKLGLGLTP